MQRVDAIVIGAGVVGLAVARALALRGRAPLIVEREGRFGSGTSSRNSEVIHAGIYYPDGSLKAALCVDGRERLYRFCTSRAVPHRQLGKIIFARDAAQGAELDAIARSAEAAGVTDLERLDAAQARRLEPALDVADALLSPSTGIIDSHAYMAALLGEAEAHGAQLVCHTVVTRIERGAPGGWRIRIAGEDQPVLEADLVVNAAGLDAHVVAAGIDALPAAHLPQVRFARGVYFTHDGKLPFSRLIYPVPEPGGLGTHLTLDMAGQARFGPDVEWIDAIDYTVAADRRDRFAAAARRIFPALDESRLQPGYAGIRPKLSGPGEPAADFLISGPVEHGLPGLVNLFGIESPGLTASLALAERVAKTLA